jgi:hypothetical protein
MKYSRLDQAELDKLEKEFIDFLVLNGITADEWEKIRKDEDKAEGMIEAFSDVVWEGTLQKTRFLIRPSERSLYAFSFGKEEASLFIAQSGDTLTQLEHWLTREDITVQYQTKPIKGDRQAEIYNLIQQGCLISEGKYYNRLALLFASQNGS